MCFLSFIPMTTCLFNVLLLTVTDTVRSPPSHQDSGSSVNSSDGGETPTEKAAIITMMGWSYRGHQPCTQQCQRSLYALSPRTQLLSQQGPGEHRRELLREAEDGWFRPLGGQTLCSGFQSIKWGCEHGALMTYFLRKCTR